MVLQGELNIMHDWAFSKRIFTVLEIFRDCSHVALTVTLTVTPSCTPSHTTDTQDSTSLYPTRHPLKPTMPYPILFMVDSNKPVQAPVTPLFTVNCTWTHTRSRTHIHSIPPPALPSLLSPIAFLCGFLMIVKVAWSPTKWLSSVNFMAFGNG